MPRKYCLSRKGRKKLSELQTQRLKKLWQNQEYRKKHFIEGKQNPKWKGGKVKHQGGYIEIYTPEKTKAGKRKYIFEHRFIMEQFLGRKLEKWEYVHHKNGIKDDNRLENLELVLLKNHFGQVRCPHCLKNFKIK